MLVVSLLLAVAIVAAIVIACRPLPEPPRHRAAETDGVHVVHARETVPGTPRA